MEVFEKMRWHPQDNSILLFDLITKMEHDIVMEFDSRIFENTSLLRTEKK